MGKIRLTDIKSEIAKSGTNKGKFLFFKDGTKKRVRFLTDMEDGMSITFHDNYSLGINVPCQEEFKRDCPYCENEELRTRPMFIWSVYDYEDKEVKLLMFPVNNFSPIPSLTSLYEAYGTLLDRDYEIKQTGSQQNKSFSVVPLDKNKFMNRKVKPLSDSEILKIVDKAYPADNNEDFGDDEEKEKPKNKSKSKKGKSKVPMNEPEETDDDWDDEDEENDYESKSAKELFKLCKERDINCKPKKSKEYYIDLLEEADEENEQDDDWDEDEEDEWED